jgi:glutathione S-transferase/AcrR family transcriptional regulator
MSIDAPLVLIGSPGSPYTRKMLAVLRYRHIAYRMLFAGSPQAQAMPQPKVRLLPTFYLPGADGTLQPVTDSTPLIRRFEGAFHGRSVIPDDPALAFLSDLIEDYADEWLTKAMFHYRWSYAADIDKAARILPNWQGVPLADDTLAAMGKMFSERQISRLSYVGSNATTGQIIEASYQRLLAILEQHLASHRFLLGDRPASADFGLFGQLSQLAQFDPTPMALTVATSPRVFAWVSSVEDLSGIEPGDWLGRDDLPATLHDLLAEIGRVYVPVLLANAHAIQNGSPEVRAEVDGMIWVQQPFAYQAKCLGWLRDGYMQLPDEARAFVDSILCGARIVAAVMALVTEGHVFPNAEQVAARADVGLRTVFRHFNDMESLYGEMSGIMERQIMAVVSEPLKASDWHERIMELVARRAQTYEAIAPFKRASDVHRHRSQTLQANVGRLVQMSRAIIRRELPSEVVQDDHRFEMIDLLMSFETWDRLRQAQGLDKAAAQALIEREVRRLIA